MSYDELTFILKKAVKIEERNVQYSHIAVKNLSILKLRDILIECSKILFEDINDSVYVAEFRSGFLKKNSAVAALKLEQNQIIVAVYAKEGILNQRTAEGAINEIREKIKKYAV